MNLSPTDIAVIGTVSAVILILIALVGLFVVLLKRLPATSPVAVDLSNVKADAVKVVADVKHDIATDVQTVETAVVTDVITPLTNEIAPIVAEIKAGVVAVETDAINVEAKTEAVVAETVAAVEQHLTFLSKLTDKMRMIVWLVAGVLLYFASIAVGPGEPIIQTTLYKLGHVTILAWVGYWISRHALGRVSTGATDGDKLARALVMAGVIIAGSLGL